MNLQKTYLSRAMTRAMALDHPIGDPFGGPAYGERRDPVSAIVAVASMAASAGGAATLIAGGLAGATLGTVAAGLAFAGGAMSLVGNITGNKDLMKIGTIASLAGGIGGFFDAAGFAGNVAKEGAAAAAASPGSAGWGADLGTDAIAASAAPAAPSVSESILGAANPDVMVNAAPAQSIAAPTPLADTSSLVAQPAGAGAAPMSFADEVLGTSAGASPLAGAGAGADAGSLAGQIAGADAGGVVNTGLISNANPNLTGYEAIANPAAAGQPGAGWQYFSDPVTSQGVAISPDGTYFGNGAGNAPMRQITGTGGGEMSFLDKAKSFMPDTSNMSTMDKWMATKVGAEVVGGITNYVAPSPETKAKTQAAQAAAAANQAQADKLKADEALRQQRLAQLRRNMGMGIDMGTVNPNAVQISGPTLRTGGGLINGVRTNG